jgi:hypothetical protein
MANVKEWLRLHWKDLAVFGVYIIVTVMMTWPVVGQLNTHLPGRGDDLLVHYWNGWRTKRLIAQGGDLYYTDLLFYPTGVSLLYHNLSWVNIALWLPLEPLVGGVAAFNLAYLLNLFLCAVGMYILARYLTRSTGAAFVAGLVYAFWPYRLFEIDHPNLIVTQWLPLLLLYLIRVVREERKIRHAVVAAVFLVLTGYARWQLLVLAALVAGLYVLYSLWFERRHWNSRVVVALAVTVVLSAALMAPALYPVARGQLTRAHPEDLFPPSLIAKQTDLLGYVVPPHNHLLEGLFKDLVYAKAWDRAWYSNAYLGYIVIPLAVAGIRRARRTIWFWGGLALVSWLLALGPALRFNRQVYYDIPLPHALVKDFLPIQIMREERRFNILLALPVAAMVSYGVLSFRDYASSLIRGRFVHVLFAGVVLLICLDYLQIPVRTFGTEISPFYQSLAAEPGWFGLLNLPTGRDRSPFYMLCQTTHGKPIVEGSVARPPREARDFVESNPFLVHLRDNRMMDPALPDVSRQLAVLAGADVRYIILNEQYAFPWEKDNWRTYLAYRPFYTDHFIAVYRTDPQEGRDFDLSPELHGGLGLVRVISSTNYIGPGSLMEVAVVWGTAEPQREDWAAELTLVDRSGQPQQAVAFPLVSGWPTSEWPANTLAHGRYAFQVDPRLPGGPYALNLTLVRQDAGERVGESVVIADALEMPLPPRVFTRPSMQVEVDALFGDVLRLMGYDLAQGGDELAVTLHWQALRRMDESYKFFVHLYDVESGELVVQADVVPRGWTYPTAWWEAEEVVSDEVRLSLSEVPAGKHRLAVGAYNPDTGERLAVRDQPAHFIVDERRLILPEEIVR